MKTVILTDIHNDWEWAELVIKHESPDEVVFCGDYFDNKKETPDDVSNTADWFHWSINQSNRIHLFGNHDIQYAFNKNIFQVSRFSQWKYLSIRSFVNQDDWNKLKFYYFIDNTWLITHAGLHPSYLPPEVINNYQKRIQFHNQISKILDTCADEFSKDIENDEMPILFNVGTSRGGWAKQGHIIWCDFDKEFTPIKGLNQIFGHTPHITPKLKIINEFGLTKQLEYEDVIIKNAQLNNVECSFNICLDTKDKYYAVWDGSELKVKFK